ncbi:MAG: four helix bundle protein [Sphingobacteriales bacterium]|jgi:four helix bundle protein
MSFECEFGAYSSELHEKVFSNLSTQTQTVAFMFDFEKLTVYSKAKSYNNKISGFIENNNLSRIVQNQLSRASFSIMLNIAEGSGRFSKPDKRNFFVIARGSSFECVAIFDFLKDQKKLTNFNTYFK